MGSSTREASAGWSPRSASKKGYFRSGGKNDNAGPEELGLSSLRSDLAKGSGVSTTIQSANDAGRSDERDRDHKRNLRGNAISSEKTAVDDTIKRIQQFGTGRRGGSISTKALAGPSGTWNSSESRLAEDSSSEEGIQALNDVPKRVLEVRKTTEFTTTREWNSGTTIGVAVSVDRGGPLQ
jgi:hypothetical protein